MQEQSILTPEFLAEYVGLKMRVHLNFPIGGVMDEVRENNPYAWADWLGAPRLSEIERIEFIPGIVYPTELVPEGVRCLVHPLHGGGWTEAIRTQGLWIGRTGADGDCRLSSVCWTPIPEKPLVAYEK